MSSRSCFSSSTISGIVVLTVLATICSVALLLYLLFGLKRGRDRYGNRLLKRFALHSHIASPPPTAASCSPVGDKSVSGDDNNASIRRPERKLRSSPNSPPPISPSAQNEKKDGEEPTVDRLPSAKLLTSGDDQPTITIRSTDLDLFEVKLENSHTGTEVCLIPKTVSKLNGGQLKLLSISVEGLEFPTIEKVLNAARGALLVCTSYPGDVRLDGMSTPFCLPHPLPSPPEHCVVDMEPLNIDTPNVQLLYVDSSAQVTPRLLDNVSPPPEPETISIAVQVGDELADSQLYHTAYGSDISDVSDTEEVPVGKEEPCDCHVKPRIFDLPIFYRNINIGDEIAMAKRPEEAIKKGLSRSVPNLQEALSNPTVLRGNTENVELCLQDGAGENLMQALNVQEILDFIDNMNLHLTVDGSGSDGAQSAGDTQMDDEQWEHAIYAALKPSVAESEDAALTKEHQQKLNYFQQQFKQQCEDLEQLGISIKAPIAQVKV
uniref:Uncharacterized protein n=1 Tax=Trichuris muris TaxID=70415 RepID=A0A5S6R408_TRIMR